MRVNKTVARYWEKNYTKDGFCILCGNGGFVSISQIGAGRVPCICPNGQSIRASSVIMVSENYGVNGHT